MTIYTDETLVQMSRRGRRGGRIMTVGELRNVLFEYPVEDIRGYAIETLFGSEIFQEYRDWVSGTSFTRSRARKADLVENICYWAATTREAEPVPDGMANVPEDLKKWLSQQVMDYTEGCVEGKIRFLQTVGLPIPPKQYEFTVRVTVSAKYLGLTDNPNSVRLTKEQRDKVKAAINYGEHEGIIITTNSLDRDLRATIQT